MGEFADIERLGAYADLITPKLFHGGRTMRIYGENHRLIHPNVEVAWMPHGPATARLRPMGGYPGRGGAGR
jgi:hypothetical protein